MEAQKEILELTRELEHAGFLYYVKDAPEMTEPPPTKMNGRFAS